MSIDDMLVKIKDYGDFRQSVGLFEGEGCIGLYKRSDRPNVKFGRLELHMTDKDVLDKFAGITDNPRVNGPYEHNDKPGKYKKKRKPRYRWAVGQKDELMKLLHKFLPYLGERRTESALAVINHYETIN